MQSTFTLARAAVSPLKQDRCRMPSVCTSSRTRAKAAIRVLFVLTRVTAFNAECSRSC
ncbi:MAG: hypothetical protein QY328_00365 [Anaerolineales bacterium]|nr:MAG: hypothetical protein QY328_00365 [Anaerolineales bacterium]